ncbi:hypothetical protein Syun_023883 [Stephania yunnanensis]|uniref:Uncharacterized protein n=1 Tax=Stephania yunnanensis TaxID=152371 RepID=A0AAP0FDM1_9MAGN
MADALSVIPTTVLRNLSDKLYEKRKNAVHEIEEIVKQLAMAGDHDKITTMMNLLTNEFTSLPQANHRKVGVPPMDESKVTMKGRLGPGMMIALSATDQRQTYSAADLLLISDIFISVADQQQINNSFQQQNNMFLICR